VLVYGGRGGEIYAAFVLDGPVAVTSLASIKPRLVPEFTCVSSSIVFARIFYRPK